MSGGLDMQRVLGLFEPVPATLHPRQRQVCVHIRQCRTPALGGMRWQCGTCRYERPVFHACRDRHCPKCQRRASQRWAARQRARVLPVTYFHVVFTLPDVLNPWVRLYPRALYDQLFASAWATLSRFGADPRRLGGTLGASAVLHTWGQTLVQHVHLHCLVPGGALGADGRWRSVRSPYLFPVRALSRHFRGHYVAALRRRGEAGEFARQPNPGCLDALLDALMASEWVVYSKPALGRTETVIDYLARYTHRTALTDGRLVAGEGDTVGLRYRDYRDGRRKTMWMDGSELVRRFLLHVLPKGLMRIRHYGVLANCRGAKGFDELRAAIDNSEEELATSTCRVDGDGETPVPRCPQCHEGRLEPIAPIAPARIDSG